MINENLLNADGYAFECPLADSLDSSVKSSLGISGGISKEGNEIYYNTTNKNDGVYNNFTPTPEEIQAALKVTTSVASGISQKRAGQVCKKPLVPESFYNHGKWNTYKDCLRSEKEKQDAIEQAKAEAEALAKAGRSGSGNNTIIDDTDKILGMPKNVAIGIGVVLSLAVVGFVGYKIYKSKKG